jgi:hypothetical protein
MMTADDYRAQAAECLHLLKHVVDEKARLALIEIAQILLRLADQSEKNSQTDVVYETPSRRVPLA